jgi:hypothetical protein
MWAMRRRKLVSLSDVAIHAAMRFMTIRTDILSQSGSKTLLYARVVASELTENALQKPTG